MTDTPNLMVTARKLAQRYNMAEEPKGVFGLPSVTRVEVISDKREFVTWKARNIRLSLQDGERTLKVFMEKEGDV